MRTISIRLSEIKRHLKLTDRFPTEEIMLEIFIDGNARIIYPCKEEENVKEERTSKTRTKETN